MEPFAKQKENKERCIRHVTSILPNNRKHLRALRRTTKHGQLQFFYMENRAARLRRAENKKPKYHYAFKNLDGQGQQRRKLEYPPKPLCSRLPPHRHRRHRPAAWLFLFLVHSEEALAMGSSVPQLAVHFRVKLCSGPPGLPGKAFLS